jgi:hypothetical protein
MPLLTIKASNENIPAGSHKATFRGIEQIEVSRQAGKEPAWRWVFYDAANDRTITGISDYTKPTTNNKFGRWLAALSGKPLSDGTAVNTDDYIGKEYVLIVVDKDGKTALNTFARL